MELLRLFDKSSYWFDSFRAYELNFLFQVFVFETIFLIRDLLIKDHSLIFRACLFKGFD